MRDKLFSGDFKTDPSEQLVINLVNGFNLSQTEVALLGKLLGIGLADKMRLLLVRPVARARQLALPLVRFMLAEQLGGAFATVLDNNILCIVDAGYFSPAHESRAEAFEAYLEDNGFIACLSRTFSDVSDIQSHYKMASRAIKLKEQIDPDHNAFFNYDTYMPLHLISASAKVADLESFVAPEISTLVAYDEAHGTELAGTLLQFYRNTCDIKRTSKALNFHYNTIDYRLRRITEICGTDVRDPDVVVSLQLSLLIVRYLKLSSD